MLSQVDLQSGKSSTIEQLPNEQFAYRFGLSSTDRLVLIDASAMRYRVVNPSKPPASSYWTEIRSDLVDGLLKQKSNFQSFGNARVVEINIFSHWVSDTERDVFLVAEAQKGVGQYALEVDSNGRETRRFLFKWPLGNLAISVSRTLTELWWARERFALSAGRALN